MGKKALLISIVVCALAFIAAVVIYFRFSAESDALFSENGNNGANISGGGLTGLIMPNSGLREETSSVSEPTLPLPVAGDTLSVHDGGVDSKADGNSLSNNFQYDDELDFEYSAPDDGWLNGLVGITGSSSFFDDEPPSLPYDENENGLTGIVSPFSPDDESSSQTYSEPEIEKPASLLYDYTNKWAYSQLSGKLKQVYALIYKAAEDNTDLIGLAQYELNEDELGQAYWAFDYDNPQFLRLGSGYGYTVQSHRIVSMNIQYGRSLVPQDQFDETAKTVLNGARQYGDDYERVKYIHDWIVNNTKYVVSNEKYSSEADGPVVNGDAICEGYSKAFMYFCQSLDIPCVCVGGFANGEGHMWNKVKIGGKWYNIDVTWDDPVTSTGDSMLRYDYFLKSDQTFKADHRVDSTFGLPQAQSDYAA